VSSGRMLKAGLLVEGVAGLAGAGGAPTGSFVSIVETVGVGPMAGSTGDAAAAWTGSVGTATLAWRLGNGLGAVENRNGSEPATFK
jgi:hypothetical protein